MILGIDLGTKNSLIGFYDGTINLVKNEFDSMMTPSVVHIDENGSVIVGQLAKQRLLTHPDRTFEMFKREMGSKTTYKVNGKVYTPTHFSSFILQKLVHDFTSQHDAEIEGVIISVPAYFNESQRYETKKAGRLAGLNVIQVLNEPSAAALYSNQGAPNFDKTLILDLGGGTFDITVVECFEQVFEILSIAGDVNLGGQDYTNALVDLCCERENITKSEELINLCEQAKMNLTSDTSVAQINYQGKVISITFEDYYKHVTFINQRIYPVFIKAIRDAEIHDINNLENIIFIGGGSKLYAFRKYIYTLLSTTEENASFVLEDDCDYSVAKGVVLYTGMIGDHDEVSDIVLTDVCPFSLGIGVHTENRDGSDGVRFEALIPRNTALPVTRRGSYSPVHSSQKKVYVKVFQGESFSVENNTLLGDIEIPCSSKEDRVIISFTYDINSILKVNVKNVSMNIEKEIFIHHDEELNDKNKEELISELNSIKYIDRQEKRQDYYFEKLHYLFENASPHRRDFYESLIQSYTKAVNSGTHKQQRLIEDRIDREETQSINLGLEDSDSNPFYN